MGCGRKRKRSGDDLSGKLHGLNQELKGAVAIDKKLQGTNLKIFCKFFPKLLVVLTHIGKPCRIPYIPQHLSVFIQRRKAGFSYIYDVFIYI